jgi:hypothetical protein
MLDVEDVKKVRLKLYEKFKDTQVGWAYETDISFTCDTCLDNDTCAYSFDAYNTNGDCLAIK